MTIYEKIINHETGSSYYRIKFEVLMEKGITYEQWYEVNHKIEDLIEEIQTRDERN